jgi:putative membrane-bound dehydrogenase-like protein
MKLKKTRRGVRAVGAIVVLCLGSFGSNVEIAYASDQPAESKEVHGPLSPDDALREMRLDPGLRIELVAAEPDVTDPVAVAFDEDGRLWVVEMGDYPNGPMAGQLPEGKIRVLEDRDNDGRYERNTLFAEHLLFGNGLLPWRGGVVVTEAPSIVYLRDTDGDGKADQRQVLYEGFTAKNPQLRVSHPNLGIDNWIYVANGLRGGQIVRGGNTGAKPIDLGGMDFRFDLVHDREEAISGMGQFGLTFDDWGQRFVCDNRHHLRHVVLPNRYIKRNPYLAVPQVVDDVSLIHEEEVLAGGKIFPLSKNWTTFSTHAGRFTAACGVFVYRGDLLPPSYHGAAFTCDPTGNLVHEERLEPRGASFRSRPAREGVEFLATRDDWFRPVSMALGPDGALYVVDMYRAVIEHPEFMPNELKNRPDLTLGKDRGRIWRIVPESFHERAARPQLGQASVQDLIALLEHSNAWWRTTAQRLLLERQDRTAVEPLRKLAGSSPQPLARLHAAWLLEGLRALDDDLVLRLLDDPHPRVREHAVCLAEPKLASAPPFQKRVGELANDSDPRVRFQVALSLGEWNDDQVLEPLATIAIAGASDQWTREAVASAVPERAGALLVLLLRPDGGLTSEYAAGRIALLRELAALAGARRNAGEVKLVLDAILSLAGPDVLRWQMAGLNGLADGMGRRGSQLGAFLKSMPDSQKADSQGESLTKRVESLLEPSVGIAGDRTRDLDERLDAVRLLAHSPWEKAGPALVRLTSDDPVQEIRIAAVRALAGHSNTEVGRRLMDAWKSATPAVRREILSAMLRQPDRIESLLDEVEARRILPGDIDALSVRQLENHGRTEIRERARRLLQENVTEERKQVLARYQDAIARKGDALRGRSVFQKNCATCHQVGRVGVRVGPDIADRLTKSRNELLADILNPNQAIDGNFINYVVSTKQGAVLNGLIATETASSITLIRAENQSDVVLREDIDEIRSSGESLMPEGLEKNISLDEMADLITFLKDWRYLDGSVPHQDEPPP